MLVLSPDGEEYRPQELGQKTLQGIQGNGHPEDIVAPALLKLDVQGYELQALKGCETLLGRFAYVYAECSFVELYAGQALADEVIAWLRERGFLLRGVYNMSYDGSGGRAIQADFLFARG